jgi:hypothetical protein
MSTEINKELTENAMLIGRVTMQWTTIQAAVSHLFRRFSGLDPLRAEAIFFAVKSDTIQRDMTLAAARIALSPFPDLLERTESLFAKIGRLSSERNAATHTMWAVKMPEGRVTPYPSSNQHRRLKIDDHRAQFEQLIAQLNDTFRKAVQLEADAKVRFSTFSQMGQTSGTASKPDGTQGPQAAESRRGPPQHKSKTSSSPLAGPRKG